MSTDNSPAFFEKVLIKLLFTDEKVREKIIPFLSEKYFDEKNNMNIIKNIILYQCKYSKFPTVSEMKIAIEDKNTYDNLVEVLNLDLKEYDHTFIIDQIEDFFRNKLISDCNTDIAIALNENKKDKISECIEKLSFAQSFTFNTDIGLDFKESAEHMYNFYNNKDFTVPSGIKTLDTILDGGFHNKTVTLFMAETNLGKSMILCSCASNSLLNNKNVLYITLEMSKEKITNRIYANTFNIDSPELKFMSKDKIAAKIDFFKNSLKGNLVVVHYPQKTANVNNIRFLLKELKEKKKFVPDIVYLDYMELLKAIYINKSDNSYSEDKRVSSEVCGIAAETDIPWVSGWQGKRCLELFTKINIIRNDIIKNNIYIKDIEVNDYIETIQNNEIKYNKVIKKYDIEENDCYEITLKSGKKIICSAKHLFPTNNGLKNIKLGLKIGDKLTVRQCN